MAKRSKRMKQIDQMVDLNKVYSLQEAVRLLKQCLPYKIRSVTERGAEAGH